MSNPIGASPWTDNRPTARLRLRYPIIQGPFGGFASQKLTAAVSNYGALGSFGASSLTPDALREVVREIKKLTSQPFAINLWASLEDAAAFTSTEEAFQRSVAPLLKHLESIQKPTPEFRPYQPIR